MKTLIMSNGEVCDQLETLEEAINVAIAGWHEDSKPQAYTIRDEEDLIAVTIAPIGSDSACVVYSHGQVDYYTSIHYLRNGNGKLVTRFYYNGSPLYTVIDI